MWVNPKKVRNQEDSCMVRERHSREKLGVSCVYEACNRKRVSPFRIFSPHN